MSFDYEQIYLTDKTVKEEKFNNIAFKISNYTLFVETYGSGPDESHFEHYIIELENPSKQMGLLEISIPNVWTSIKNHLRIGTEVNANGLYHYDKNENLKYIEVESFRYNNIYISNKEVSSDKGKTTANRELVKDKKILTMLIIWIVLLFLIKISIKVFGILFLIDTIIIATYATIGNKKISMNVDSILEQSGLEKIEQQHSKVIR